MHPEPDKVIWFPHFYENEEWRTWIAKDQRIIYEKRKNDNGRYIFECLDQPDMFKRLVLPLQNPGRMSLKDSLRLMRKSHSAQLLSRTDEPQHA